MAGATQIGTGAVVLTANADQLLTGLDKGGAAIDKWASRAGRAADKVSDAMNRRAHETRRRTEGLKGEYSADVDYSKAMGGPKGKGKGKGKEGEKGGGLFGAALAGGAAGLAMAALTGVGKAVGHLIEKFATLNETAAKYGNIDVGRTMRIDGAQKAVDRMTAAGDDFLLRVGEQLGPTLEKIATIVEVVGHVGAEAFASIVDGIGEAIDELLKWLGEIVGAGALTETVGDRTFAVLRAVGEGLAWLWDSAKAAAGGIALVAGSVAESFGAVLKTIGESVKALDDFIAALSPKMKVLLFGTAGANLTGGLSEYGARVEKIGAGIADWGANAVAGFGSSAGKINEWFDRVEAGFNNTERLAKATGTARAGAFGKGSTEAYSVLAKFQAGNILTGQSSPDNPVKIAKEQLKEAKEAKRALWKIVAAFDTGTTIKVIP